MTKESWRQRWLNSINELTSIDLQTKAWLDFKNTNPHWSFIEFNACYFDELSLAYDNFNYQHFIIKGWITKQEYEIIKNWHEALDKYEAPKNNSYDHMAILNDTAWLDIVKMGMVAKNKLKELLNKEELQYLLQNIDYLKYT